MPNNDNIAKDNGKSPTVPVSTLAKLFNLTSVRIQQLASDGVVIRSARGRYDLWSSVRNYIGYLQERKVNQWDTDEENPSEIKKHQLRRTKEEADKLELANARTRGDLVEVWKVISFFEKQTVAMRSVIINSSTTEDAKDKLLGNLARLKDFESSDE
jgi:phage terminase Nu1 subunit (DNA packaging protein)|tara:strand:- start:359 stop:829 length:471 start_codon:yes stop_codon:yes gene_type:complete